MSETMSGLMVWATSITLALLLLGVLCAVTRLRLGPSLPDRVVALDLIAAIMIAFIAVFSIVSHDATFTNVGLALGLISFLSTVAFARYIERRAAVEHTPIRPIEHSISDWGGDTHG